MSCDGVAEYEATLVRLIQGDTHPDGPGYREEPLPIDLGGPFKGRHQPLRTGSRAQVEDRGTFDTLRSLCITLIVWPTMPGRGLQTLLCRKEASTGFGFELLLDEGGAPCFEIVSPRGPRPRVTTHRALLSRRWYAIRAGYDADRGEISVSQTPLAGLPGEDGARTASSTTEQDLSIAEVRAPLLMAAAPDGEDGVTRCFNGRLESPRLFAMSPGVHGCGAPSGRAGTHAIAPTDPRCLAAWDFSIDIPSTRIVDVSGRGLHGRLINLPARGVTGSNWDGSVHDWTQRPEHYGAIHFHDDDLHDAGWRSDFRWRVPEHLSSGVHAVRLHAGKEEFHVPFCIRPSPAHARREVAFLMPTASYLAYANNRIGIDVPETELVCGRLIRMNEQDLFLQEHPELGLSFYDLHNDGSGVYYSSRLRPIIDLQPKFVGKLGGRGSNVWQFNADTHLLGWLDSLDQPFDVLTDEDLHHEGLASIGDYRVLITGTHPEYHSRAMLDALSAYTEQGGRLMYLGGNGFYWRVSWHPELPGVLECRKSENGIRAFPPGPGEYHASFTGEYTGLWRYNGRPPNALVGVGMAAQGFDVSSPYRRTPASRDPRVAFVFEGVDEDVFGDFGLSGGGAAGLEVDRADHALGTPRHALVLASSERHTDLYLMTPEDMLDPAPGLGGTEAESIGSDVVFFETRDGGAVFSVGSIAWAGSMAWNGYDNSVARITANVLVRFLDAEPL